MPAHCRAWISAFKSVAGLDVTEREIYLLEGMRGEELVRKVFSQKGFTDHSVADQVVKEKNANFRKSPNPKAFPGVEEMVQSLACRKAVVSGSEKSDVEEIIRNAFRNKTGLFDLLITAGDTSKGKPDPSAFLLALKKLDINPADAIVVENAPLGAMASNRAGIPCVVVLNDSPLGRTDFDGIIGSDRIFEKTTSISHLLFAQ